jgi:hypothetical protein
LPIPAQMPPQWVVHCACVGRGLPALLYLSRYLYRGVISEKKILSDHDGQVTFEYLEGRSGQRRTRTLKGEDFLWLVLQHVLPKAFRRVRDYGFLHGNARKTLQLVQLVLQVVLPAPSPCVRPVFCCPHCKAPTVVTAVLRRSWRSG